MKLLIASDIHLEFGERWMPPDIDYDAIVLAGDVHVGIKGFRLYGGWMDRWMVYVAGNHEFYAQNLPATVRQLQGLGAEAERVGSFYLEKSSTEIDRVRFIGCTLWTDFCLFGAGRQAEAMAVAEERMADYHKIIVAKDGPLKVRLKPADTLRMHHQSRAWIERELAKSHDGPTIVVTHHAPSLQSVPERFRDDLIAAAYASDLEAVIDRYQPALWIHGHTHVAVDYHIGATRIVANPRGYPGETYAGFRPRLVVEV